MTDTKYIGLSFPTRYGIVINICSDGLAMTKRMFYNMCVAMRATNAEGDNHLSGKSFRDPIHGYIDVDDLELAIIDSMPFQRLRSIRQLGTSYLVYHGAEHTRFGHSLGVMHLVSKTFDSALANYKERSGNPLFDDTTQRLYRRILRLIALVHDLGHPPFSHAGEGIFVRGVKHEHFTKKILFDDSDEGIAKIIRGSGDITPELIWLIYGEKDSEAFKNPEYKLPDYKLKFRRKTICTNSAAKVKSRANTR